MKEHFKKQLKLLESTSFNEVIANSLIDDCLLAIKSNNSIIVSALGKNVPICEKFIGTLNSLSIKANFMHTNSAIHGDLGMINQGDLVLVLSKSGNTDETITLLNLLKKRKVIVWLLTCSSDSEGEKLSDKCIILKIKHEGDPWNLIPNISSLTFLVFLQAISMKLIDKLAIPLESFKKNHPGGSIGKILRKK
ncbi:MAG: SIS domain-containing protein [Candidatus Paceibacterota bacterium]|jgi:arabinose-5-phosphate isomerase